MLLNYYLDADCKQNIDKELRVGSKLFDYKKMSINDYIEISFIEKILQAYSEYIEIKMMQEGAFGEIKRKRLEDEIKMLEKKLRNRKYILRKIDS